MINKRIIIEKKETFDIASRLLFQQIQKRFSHIKKLRIYLLYDVFNIDSKVLDKSLYSVFADITTDIVHFDKKILGQGFGIEYLPGQFDQRVTSAEQALALVGCKTKPLIQSSKWIHLVGITKQEIEEVKKMLINTVDSREKIVKNIQTPTRKINTHRKVKTYSSFLSFDKQGLQKFHQEHELAMDMDDLQCVQEYFKTEKRNPTETEIKVLDTYWSDHCRHTTFLTEIENIRFEGKNDKILMQAFEEYKEICIKVGKSLKRITLMDLATIMTSYLCKKGKAKDVFQSKENNAATIEIECGSRKHKEKWLLLFKNETHNHPTEIEPFGGAATCIGGAIRDPLSGRAYVYQAMRVSGAANPLQKWEDTLKGKLPQQKITQEAALGYSSYGNQIGLATSHIAEIYHPGYIAKRMEVGFVVGAVKKKNIIQKQPQKGDVVLLIGGRTGRDGIGGATGSSKSHTNKTVDTMQAEVQKGNPPEERKIQRLFRNPQFTKLIKKCNDFGAGGVSVAIGELADGVKINLNKIPTKYQGLNGTELAISESQERMAIVVAEKHVSKVMKYCKQENVESTKVAKVIAKKEIIMEWNKQKIVQLKRSFLNTNGAKKRIDIITQSGISYKDFLLKYQSQKENDLIRKLSSIELCSQKGLVDHFDSTIGKTTVLMPLGGKYQRTPQDGSVHLLPTFNPKETLCSIATWGYNPYLFSDSCYYGAQYAVIESVAKVVALGGNAENIRISFQEYFEKLHRDPKKWGKPFSALLGAIRAQKGFEIPAIGGKDSMSGSFEKYHVPPTLISFAVCTEKINNILSAEIKKTSSDIYLLRIPVFNGDVDYILIKKLYKYFYSLVKNKVIFSAKQVGYGGVAYTLTTMCFGNKIGFKGYKTQTHLLEPQFGSILFEVHPKQKFNNKVFSSHIEKIGNTIQEQTITFTFENSKEKTWTLDFLYNKWSSPLQNIFPEKTIQKKGELPIISYPSRVIRNIKFGKPHILIPIFYGTNCEYDTQFAFEQEKGIVEHCVISNHTIEDLRKSITRFVKKLKKTQILSFVGGFSAGDEPDGSAKYIATFLKNSLIAETIHKLLEKEFLILGICNGFQALVKSGLLPYGHIVDRTEKSPTLTTNTINRHISQMASVKVVNDASPWLQGMKDEIFTIPVSHGEGRFYASKETLNTLIKNQQIATQYVNIYTGLPTMLMPDNPNGSLCAIEGVISQGGGKIYGRMGHAERYSKGLLKNIPHNRYHNIFRNGVRYFL